MPLPLLNFPSIIVDLGLIVSVENVQEPGAQGASWGIDQVGQIWQGSRTYQNKLRIITSSAYCGPLLVMDALQSLGILLGAPYVFPIPGLVVPATEQDTGSFIQRVILEQETEDGRGWIATIEYGPFDIIHELGTTNVQYGSFTPLDFPPVVRWSTAKYHRSYPTDVNGKPFRNTAGDPLENPPQREESTQCLTLILWSPTYDEPYAQSFRDTINSDEFLGFAPTVVKCKDIDGERIYTADYGYVWRIIFEFELRLIVITAPGGQQTNYGWVELVLNAGFRAFGGAAGAPGALAPIIIGGVPVTSPMILNQDGTCTVPASKNIVAGQQGDQTLYLVFNNFRMSTFAGLNIDQNILTANQ